MAGKPLTLTVLGGGSFFTPSFVATMCNRGEFFAGAQVRLHDPDAARVALVKTFCERYVRSRGMAMTFLESPDLDRSLEGADFVIITFRVGGLKSLRLDETIPQRFGYYGDETLGPGGIFMAARTIPVVLDVAARMKRLCPKAWLLNYANPANFVADALHRAGHRRSVSLCDGYTSPPRDIAVTVGLDPKRVTARHAGVNHCSWVYEARTDDGRDLLEEMRHLTPEAVKANFAHLIPFDAMRWERWLVIHRAMGLYPMPNSHVEPYFYYAETVEAQRQDPDGYANRRAAKEAKNWEQLKACLSTWSDSEAAVVTRTHYGGHADLAIGVAQALAVGSGEIFPLNVPHGSAVPGFTPDTILEVYSKIVKDGYQPQPVPPFPPPVQAQQSHLVTVQKMVVTGVLEKNPRTIMQALCIHPFTNSIAAAQALFEAMWKEEKEQGVLGKYWAS